MIHAKTIATETNQKKALVQGLTLLRAKHNIFIDEKKGNAFLEALLALKPEKSSRLDLFAELPQLSGLKNGTDAPLPAIRNCLNNVRTSNIPTIRKNMSLYFESLGYTKPPEHKPKQPKKNRNSEAQIIRMTQQAGSRNIKLMLSCLSNRIDCDKVGLIFEHMSTIAFEGVLEDTQLPIQMFNYATDAQKAIINQVISQSQGS